jgi:SAM-dependent methyltransferase
MSVAKLADNWRTTSRQLRRWAGALASTRQQPEPKPRVQPTGVNYPPEDWNDRDGWDRYFNAELLRRSTATFLPFNGFNLFTVAVQPGKRVWVPGCGIDQQPVVYAQEGCKVIATDFSPVAVRYQQWLATAFQQDLKSQAAQGTFAVIEQDFTRHHPEGTFDVVISSRAFQGLSATSMAAAAKHFYAALRPGGSCVIDTINVDGPRRPAIEDSLSAAGFYIPFMKSDRWYLQVVLDRAEPDREFIDSLRDEYQRRRQDETAEVKAITSDPETILAEVIYGSG